MRPEEMSRIEKSAELYVDQFNHIASKSACYVAGAIQEHELLNPQLEYASHTINKFSEALKDERNRAIDECIKKIFEYKHIIFMADNFADELRSLKA